MPIEGKLGEATCIGGHNSGVENTIFVACTAGQDRHDISDDVIEAYGWHRAVPAQVKPTVPLAKRFTKDQLADVFVPEGMNIGQGCDKWERSCRDEAQEAPYSSKCMHNPGVEGFLVVGCTVNGNTVTGDVIEGFGFHRVLAKPQRKRNDDRRLVQIPTAVQTLGEFCGTWDGACSGVQGATSGAASCVDGSDYYKNPYVKSALVSCSAKIGDSDEWTDMTEYVIKLTGLQPIDS